MTTGAGAPVGDNQNSLTVGPGGPVLMQDLTILFSDRGTHGYRHMNGYSSHTFSPSVICLTPFNAQQRLIHNIVMSMEGVPQEIQARQIQHFLTADQRYGCGAVEGLGYNPKTSFGVEEPAEGLS